MSKDANNKPQVAEDLALRVKPQRHAGRASLWLSSKSVVLLVAFSAVVFLGVMYLLLQDAGSFSQRRVDFPPVPQLDAAIANAQERLKVNPQDITALTELGTLHFEKGKDFYPDAINELEEARDLGALDPRIFYCLGIMYQEVGLYSFALEDYKRFLRHYPDDKEIRMLEAKLLYKQGAYPEAVQEYERLKFHYPNDALIEENLGLSLWGAKLYDRAIDSFNQLKTTGKDSGKRAEFYLGQIALEQNEPQAALDHLLQCQPEQGVDLGVAPEKILGATAAAYQKLGRFADAKAAWERVVSLTPDDAKARAALREVSRKLPKTKRK